MVFVYLDEEHTELRVSVDNGIACLAENDRPSPQGRFASAKSASSFFQARTR